MIKSELHLPHLILFNRSLLSAIWSSTVSVCDMSASVSTMVRQKSTDLFDYASDVLVLLVEFRSHGLAQLIQSTSTAVNGILRHAH